jgi:hypothetical protein
MHTYFLFFLLFFLLFCFLFFIFLFFGLVQLSPHGLGWTQPTRPGHQPKPVTGQISPASVRDSRTLATITT